MHALRRRVLVLTRLLPAGEKGAKTVKIKKDLEPLLGHRWSGGVLTDVLERTLIKLVSLVSLGRLATGQGEEEPAPRSSC